MSKLLNMLSILTPFATWYLLSGMVVLCQTTSEAPSDTISSDDNDSSSSSDDDTMEEITGIIYADNYFEFYFNGEYIINDSIGFIPHNAEYITFNAPKTGIRTFAILAKDFSDDITALEYDNNCIGDGGLRAMFSDGTVTNTEWKCTTIYYGPIDGGLCFNDCYGDDCDVNPKRFIPSSCKYGQLNKTGENCTGEYYDYDNDWYTIDYNDSNWEYATEFNDDTVGWGVSPTNYYNNIYNTTVLDPLWFNWTTTYGNSSFIWRPDLDFDNRILCRYSYTVGDDGSESEEDDDDGALVKYELGLPLLFAFISVVLTIFQSMN